MKIQKIMSSLNESFGTFNHSDIYTEQNRKLKVTLVQKTSTKDRFQH